LSPKFIYQTPVIKIAIVVNLESDTGKETLQ